MLFSTRDVPVDVDAEMLMLTELERNGRSYCLPFGERW